MGAFKDKGIVIKEYFSGEYDKTIILLLKNKGKVSVYAKGARSPKNKCFAGTQLFSYCEFVIFEKNGFLSLNQVDIINSFYNISMDYDKFCNANYYIELINKMIMESMPSEDILFLLLKSLNALSKNIMDKDLVTSIFEIKFMQLEGYSPGLDSCISCGDSQCDKVYFVQDGIICNRCVHKGHKKVNIDDRVIFVINYILDAEIKNLFMISVSDEVIKNLKIVSEFFVKNNIDILLKSKK